MAISIQTFHITAPPDLKKLSALHAASGKLRLKSIAFRTIALQQMP